MREIFSCLMPYRLKAQVVEHDFEVKPSSGESRLELGRTSHVIPSDGGAADGGSA